jgi:7-cyano-7-deazaguanine synthase
MATTGTQIKKAVVLVSGGLDSATVLAIAAEQGYACHALSFAYGQRHDAELLAAARVTAAQHAVEHKVICIDLGSIGGSALTDTRIAVPESPGEGIPVTYVPARNTVFLSLALGWAEVIGADAIFIGVNQVDYSGYPDCREEYIEAFQHMANLATRAGVEQGRQITVHAPLIHMDKAAIIREGTRLGVDYSLTVSCYAADTAGRACGVCEACRLRRAGFRAAGIDDPTVYR